MTQSSKAKKARNDNINKDEQRYYDNKPAIEYWWRLQQKSPKAPWFEKLKSWEYAGSLDLRPKLKAEAPPPVPATLVQTTAMNSPAEILHIHQQWGDLKPGLRKHPMDKASVTKPEWSAEDSIANSTKHEDGMYDCMHVHANFSCCKKGLNEKGKKRSIEKQIRIFKARVEEMIVKKDLHVAHKTWTNWLKKEKLEASYSVEMARIDALLAPVHGRTQPGRAPAPPAASQAMPQQHIPLPVTAFVPPAPRAQQQQLPSHQVNNFGAAPQQSRQAAQRPTQIQQPAAVARPRGRPATQKQQPMQQTFMDAPAQGSAPETAVLGRSVAASHKVADPASVSAGVPLSLDAGFRQKAAAAIYDQKERSNRQRPVMIACIDLSKEDYHNKYEEVVQKIVAALKQQESQNSAAVVSPAEPVVAQNVAQQQAPQQPHVPSLSASPRTSHRRNGQVTLQSMREEGEEQRQRKQAPSQASSMGQTKPQLQVRNVSQAQAQIQLSQSGVTANRVVGAHLASTNFIATPRTKAEETSTSFSTSDTSFSMPATPRSEAVKHAVDYRQVAMKMFQQLIKDQEPIVLPGLKITREDFTTDMNGSVRRLATAQESEAAEAARRKTEESARSPSEKAAQPEDGDADEPMSDNVANNEDDLDYLFNNEAGDAADDGEQYTRWDSLSPHEEKNSDRDNAVTSVHLDLGASIDEPPPPETNATPQFKCQDAFVDDPLPQETNAPPQSENEEDDLAYLDVPENWYIEDPFEVIASVPYEMWQRPSIFTLDDLSYFDLDKITPSASRR